MIYLSQLVILNIFFLPGVCIACEFDMLKGTNTATVTEQTTIIIGRALSVFNAICCNLILRLSMVDEIAESIYNSSKG